MVLRARLLDGPQRPGVPQIVAPSGSTRDRLALLWSLRQPFRFFPQKSVHLRCRSFTVMSVVSMSGRLDHLKRRPWKAPAPTGNPLITSWKWKTWRFWSSMSSISKTSPDAKPLSKMRNGSPTSSNTACPKAVSSPPVTTGTAGTRPLPQKPHRGTITGSQSHPKGAGRGQHQAFIGSQRCSGQILPFHDRSDHCRRN